MVRLDSELNLFPFIEEEHPFYAPIQSLRNQLMATPLYRETRRRLHAAEDVETRVSMKAHPKSVDTWALKEFYLSIQFRDKNSLQPFNASTFVCSAKKGSIEAFEFPHDPLLTTLPTCFKNQGSNGDERNRPDVTVLRYYPRKRLTFRRRLANKTANPVIGKFVRSSSLEETYGKLVKISHVLDHSHHFSVAAPMGIDMTKGLFLQTERPGEALARLINKDNFRELLHTVGMLHQDLHCLAVPDLPRFNFDAFLRNLVTATEWNSLFRPTERSFFESIRNSLITHAPQLDTGSFTFCHGDFSCLQVVKDHDGFSVIDFDDCVLGDPCLEIAKLITFLKYDVPLFRDCFADPESRPEELLERACEAYLNGYEQKAGRPIDQKRLLWYRICFETHFLARLFKRNLFQPLVFDRTVKIIERLNERFRQQQAKGGNRLKEHVRTIPKPESARAAIRSNSEQSLNDLDTYCMFIGYPRSGHTLIGALLDAHPHMIIAHELNVLKRIYEGLNEEQIYRLLLENSRLRAKAGRETGRYSYQVTNQWQGRFETLRVIGDKQGGASTCHLRNHSDSLQRLRDTIRLKIKFVHVVRNPFDNISTIAAKKNWILADTTNRYFSSCLEIEHVKHQIPPSDLFELRHESFIDNPQLILRELCRFLGQDAADDYLNDCASIVHRASHRSRYDAQWDQAAIDFVEDRIAEFGFLKGYSFAN